MSRWKSNSSASFDETEVVLDRGGGFSVRLPSERGKGDTFLIIDIYDLDNPVHPEGHIGWSRFEIEQLPDKLNGNLVLQHDGEVSLKIEGVSSVDEWCNPSRIDAARLELLVVMRSIITNAILSIDRVPVLQSVEDLERFRSQHERTFLRSRYF